MWQDFKPAFLFLARFLGIYFFLNISYGLYIESLTAQPDVLTIEVTRQTATVLQWLGNAADASINPSGPTVYLQSAGKTVLNVFEGCNGINIMIIFVAFIFAFGGPPKALLWFIPFGWGVIHIMNLFRIVLLFYTATSWPHYFYYFHKYIFTAILYLVVFALWAIWVFRFNEKKKDTSKTH